MKYIEGNTWDIENHGKRTQSRKKKECGREPNRQHNNTPGTPTNISSEIQNGKEKEITQLRNDKGVSI